MKNIEKTYVVDKIGNEYIEWEEHKTGCLVQITAPTGSGKTYFILNVLLKRAMDKGVKILYIVNRRILKSQLEKALVSDVASAMYDVFGYAAPLDDYIKIETYQSIEERLKAGLVDELNREMAQCTYVIYDECHYFYSDSNFNTCTEVSYDYLRKTFEGRIQIFMSATMKKMEKFIDERSPFSVFYFDEQEQKYVRQKQPFRKIYTYNATIDYNYVHLKYFEKIEDIEQIVKERASRKEKWLIFTDSIERGEKIRNSLIQKSDEKSEAAFREEDVVFIDAKYNRDTAAQKSVEQLNAKQYINKKVVIATAVMDNGVSFHDKELRNLILLADTEEEFIQMLGRKREDGECVRVYVCKRDINHFQRRLQYVENALKTLNVYFSKLDQMYWFEYCIGSNNYRRKISPVIALMEDIGLNSYFSGKLLDDIIEYPSVYNNIRKCCYVFRGILAFNSFSIDRLYSLKAFYLSMIEELEKDENAFVKKQAEWLGFSIEQTQKAVIQSQIDVEKNYCENITAKLEKILAEKGGEPLTGKEIAELKKTIMKELRYFYKKAGNNSEPKDLIKSDRGIKPEDFNTCMKCAELPYKMLSPKKNNYFIEKTIAEN